MEHLVLADLQELRDQVELAERQVQMVQVEHPDHQVLVV
jgi:hypothetical protein